MSSKKQQTSKDQTTGMKDQGQQHGAGGQQHQGSGTTGQKSSQQGDHGTGDQHRGGQSPQDYSKK